MSIGDTDRFPVTTLRQEKCVQTCTITVGSGDGYVEAGDMATDGYVVRTGTGAYTIYVNSSQRIYPIAVALKSTTVMQATFGTIVSNATANKWGAIPIQTRNGSGTATDAASGDILYVTFISEV